MASMASVREKTYQYQDTLSPLPVPPLQQSLDKYLESVKPFVTEDEYKHTEQIVRDFGNGVGRELQAKLEERGRTHRNWLEEWWDELAYLSGRDSIAVSVNYGGPYPFHEDIWPPKYGTQLERMALFLWTYAKTWIMFRREELPVDKAKALGNKPVCMNQYRNLFNVCRIPGVTKDTLVKAFKTESEGPCPSHVIIFRNGHMFSLDIIDENGEPVTAPEIQNQLAYIKSKCEGQPAAPGIGALTALDRTTWAETRQHLIEIDPDNRKGLHAIETSIICMVMDMDSSPTTMEQIGSLPMIGADIYNRWFDKGTCVMVFSNGTVGADCDHAPADAISAVMTVFEMHNILKKINGKWQGGPPPKRNLPLPEELKFSVDEKIKSGIKDAAEQYLEKAKNLQIVFRSFQTYGKKTIRTFQVHPDTFLQQVLQLSYYKLHRKPAPTYETGTTRQFYHGRTETVRACTVESLEWCKAMVDEKCTVTRKIELFHRSVDKHNQLMLDAVQGQGCDRHLLGLQILAAYSGNPMPEIFTDQAWTKSGGNGNFVLSTSLIGYTQCTGGFAPMLPNGYGITYNVLNERIGFTITAWNDHPDTDALTMYSTLVDTMNEMRALLTNSKL
ncbi:peroxisomal carnitine O-octanoyltransferase-like [Glandiceps talaboti]